MERRLTLHIGMPDTGGSAIQTHLNLLGPSVCPVLLPIDLLVLGGTDQAVRRYSRRFGGVAPNMLAELREELASGEDPHSIISSEFLFESTDPEFVQNLKIELGRIFSEIRIVVYLRHQADHFLTQISKRVEAGAHDWSEITSLPQKLYEYDRICDVWANEFPLIVRDFSRCGSNVVADFCEVVGLPESKHRIPAAPTEILDDQTLRLLALVNACADRSKVDERQKVVRELKNLKLSKRRFCIEDATMAKLMTQFEDGNMRVAKKWLGGVPLNNLSIPLDAQ